MYVRTGFYSYFYIRIVHRIEYTQLRTELVVPVITDCNLHFSFLFSREIRTA